MSVYPGTKIEFDKYGKYLPVRGTVAELRLYPTADLDAGDMIKTSGSVVYNDGVGADWTWDPTSQAVDDGSSVIQPGFLPAGRWIRVSNTLGFVIDNLNGSSSSLAPSQRVVKSLKDKLDLFVTVTEYGAKGDGNADDTQAIKAAIATGKGVFFPNGTYKITEPLQLNPGQHVSGVSSGYYSNVRSFIFNTVPNSGIFWNTLDTSTQDRDGPVIENLFLSADYPIRMNNETTAVINDGAGNCPPILRVQVYGCVITSRQAGAGIGIAMTKVFDSRIQNNIIIGFNTTLLLNACDINKVSNNRFLNAGDYHILELSVLSFGSQNEVSNNDMLHIANPQGSFVKSTGRHARYYNNYCEQGDPILTFFDFSFIDVRRFNNQTPGIQLSVIARDNRIDGQQLATFGAYRVQQGPHAIDISDVGTSSSTGGFVVVDSNANRVSELPVRYNQQNGVTYSFKGPGFGAWDGFRTTQRPTMTIESSNLGQFGGQLFTNNAQDFLRVSPNAIVFKNGFTSVVELTSIGYLEPGTSYTITFRARTKSGTESLGLGTIAGAGGSSLQYVSVNTGWQNFAIGFTTNTDASLRNGPYFNRSNNGSDIEIESIKFEKGAEFTTNGFVVGDTYTYNAGRTSGTITIQETEGTVAVFTNAEYKFINGKLALVGKAADNPSVVDLTFSQSGSTITFTLTGSASGKRLSLSHKY